jgi:hypothetical protein
MILWGNDADEVELDVEAQIYVDADSVAEVYYSCMQDELADFSGGIKIGVYAPEPYEANRWILPHILGLCETETFYNYPVGIDVIKAGLSRELSVDEVKAEDIEYFNDLRDGLVPSRVVLIRDMSGSLGYPGEQDEVYYVDEDEGIDQFADYLEINYQGLTIEVIDSYDEDWLMDIANEINN